MAFQKAKIIVHRKDGTEQINVLFNPAEYNLTDAANYAEKVIPGLNRPVTQFVSGMSSTLSMVLMFDTYDTDPEQAGGDVSLKLSRKEVKPTNVTILTRKITELTHIDGQLHRPPICEFVWGALKFKGVIKAVNSTYTMFLDSGMPVRAKLEVLFQSVIDPTESKKVSPFESPDRTKYRTMEEGMSLWLMAENEYDDPEKWREIAKCNKIINPLEIKNGDVLKIPPL